ncbi:MAG: hypothetical protein KA732_12275 [Providencia sp.]|nr:hypothetical protein [Providencia sp.]MBP6082038.1 hypothetical protein [Providencia sp.]
MEKNRYQALYRVLILMWGQWNRNRALSIGKISTLGQLSVYERRIKKLFTEFNGEKITPHPRWLMGFTLGEQGVKCRCCNSSNLQTVRRTVSPLDNPNIVCKSCGYTFKLNECFDKYELSTDYFTCLKVKQKIDN